MEPEGEETLYRPLCLSLANGMIQEEVSYCLHGVGPYGRRFLFYAGGHHEIY